MLPDFTPVAVKKLEGILQVEQQFRSKISTIGAIHHLNLICLSGFCSGCTKKLLVYEYTPKGSLDVQLFQSSSMALDYKVPNFSWNCKGVILSTRGMPDCISHYDIKRGKILLDASFVPKLADFGLGKLVGRDFSSILTKMRGTIGYLAPEWIPGGSITAKADVYGYGMMLEITSGRRNIEPLTMEKGKAYFLALLACNKVVEGDVIDLLDHRVEGDVNDEELDRMLKVASWCIQDEENCRPTSHQWAKWFAF